MDGNDIGNAGKCPVMHATAGTRSNRDWWPNQLNLRILHQNAPESDPMPKGFDYAEAFEALDLDAEHAPKPEDDVMRVTGKGSKVRLVPILPAAYDAVEAYKQVCPFPLEPGTPLFRGVRGKRLNARNVQLLVQKLRGYLGLPDTATPQALRHSSILRS